MVEVALAHSGHESEGGVFSWCVRFLISKLRTFTPDTKASQNPTVRSLEPAHPPSLSFLFSPSYSFFFRSSPSTIHFVHLEFLLSQVLDWIVTCFLPHNQTLQRLLVADLHCVVPYKETSHRSWVWGSSDSVSAGILSLP